MITARQTARVFGLSMVQVKTCAQCGKRFSIVSPDYAYKLEGGKGAKRQAWFCSYGCMRIVQKPLEEARKAEFEERVFRDVFGLDEGEKHNQRTLAAYHAKKQAEDAAMTEKEREDKAARLAEAKRLAGQASDRARREKAESERVERALERHREAFRAEIDRMPKTNPVEMDKESIERAKVDAMICRMCMEAEWRKKKRKK